MRESLRIMSVVVAVYAAKVVIKLSAGFMLGSEMLIGDGFHNIADIFEAIGVMVAIAVARRKPNQRFPLGFMNIESIGSLVIGAGLLLLSLRMFSVSVVGALALVLSDGTGSTFLETLGYAAPVLDPLRTPVLAFITLGSCAVSILLSRYEISNGTRLHSPLMVDDGRETRSDAWVEGCTFLGVLAYAFTGSVIPELLVVGYLGHKLLSTGLEILKPALDTLLLHSIDDEHEAGLVGIAEKSGVLGVAGIRTHRVGRHMAVISMKVLVEPKATTVDNQVHKHELVRRFIVYLAELGYVDARFEIRYGYPGEPSFDPKPKEA